MEDLFPVPSLSAAHSLLWSGVNRLEGWGFSTYACREENQGRL